MTGKTNNKTRTTAKGRGDHGDRNEAIEGRDRSEGLGLLLADVMASDDVERENLVRYAEDADALGAAERRAVEARVAADPSWRDRLTVLQNFDPRAADPSALDGADENVVPLSQGRPRTRMAWFAMAAAAGLMAIALVPLLSEPGDERGTLAKREAPNTQRPGESVRQDDPVSIPSRSIPLIAAQTTLALGDRVEQPEAGTATDSVEFQIRGVEGDERNVEASSEIAASDAATNPPEEADNLDVGVVDDAGDDAGNGIAEAGAETLLLARLDPIDIPVAYRAPSDFLSREVPRDVVRGAAGGPTLVTWVPDHVAHSATSQPTLYWALSGSLPEAGRVGIVLTSEDDPEPLYEGFQPVDPTQVRQQTPLASLGVSLKAGEVYRWSVFVRVVEGDPSADRIAQGWIEYRAPSEAFATRIAREPRWARAAAYAEQVYWYDALALLVDIDGQHPDRVKARQQLVGFLANAGIDSAAD